MVSLALRSIRFRPGGVLASFLAMFFGAIVLMAFGSLLDTAGPAGVDPVSAETMTIIAGVVGGWGLVLVSFAVTSTMTLRIQQRGEEIALLKNVGATPAQLTRMVLGEAAVLALVAVLLAVAPAMLAGRLLFRLLVDSGQVNSTVEYAFGGFAIQVGFIVVFLATMVGAAIAAQRTTRMRASESLTRAAVEPARTSRVRIVAGCVSLFLGVNLAVVTATVMRGEGFEAMATAGPASIWFSIGLALLAPVLIRAVLARLAPVTRLGGVAGYLAGQNLAKSTGQLAAVAVPIILFTGIATATLYMNATDNAARSAAGIAKTIDYQQIETLNLVVVGMILMFVAIMVINTIVAAMAHRRREFGQHRLAGATPGQVLGMVATEAVLLTAGGVLLGTFASLFTIVPFSIARTGGMMPAGSIGIYLGVVAVAAVLALGASLGAGRRAIRGPAIQAVAA